MYSSFPTADACCVCPLRAATCTAITACSTRGSRGCATYTQAKEPLSCGRTHEAEPSACAAHVVAQHIHKRKNLCAVDPLGGIQPTCNLSALTPICTFELNFLLLRCISPCVSGTGIQATNSHCQREMKPRSSQVTTT